MGYYRKNKTSSGKCFTWNRKQWKGKNCNPRPVHTICGCRVCTPCGKKPRGCRRGFKKFFGKCYRFKKGYKLIRKRVRNRYRQRYRRRVRYRQRYRTRVRYRQRYRRRVRYRQRYYKWSNKSRVTVWGRYGTRRFTAYCRRGVRVATQSRAYGTNGNCSARDQCRYEMDRYCRVRAYMWDRCRSARRRYRWTGFGTNVNSSNCRARSQRLKSVAYRWRYRYVWAYRWRYRWTYKYRYRYRYVWSYRWRYRYVWRVYYRKNKTTGKCFTWNRKQWKGKNCNPRPVHTICGCRVCTPCGKKPRGCRRGFKKFFGKCYRFKKGYKLIRKRVRN